MKNLHSRAEILLSQAWGETVQLGPFFHLNGREHVARAAVLKAPTGAAGSVVIKRYRTIHEDQHYEPQSNQIDSPASLLFNEWASLIFLNEVTGDDPIAPRFYVGDKTQGYFIMEELIGEDPLKKCLQGDDFNQAEDALKRTYSRLGLLHAKTHGSIENFVQHRQALGPFSVPGIDRYHRYSRDARYALERIGVSLSKDALADMERACQLLANPGPFSVFTHGDAVLGNWVEMDGKLRLYDFEASAPRHALFEGAFLRMHFPTSGLFFVNRMPESAWRKAEAAYRQALASGCAIARDDQAFGRAMTAACAFWIMTLCQGYSSLELAVREDGVDWINPLRQRILMRLDIFTQTTQEFGFLEAFGQTIAALSGDLHQRWPAEAINLPLYPAFVTAQ